MARMNLADARELRTRSQQLEKNLRDCPAIARQQREAVLAAVEQVAIAGARDLLSRIPVEEVNQRKEGIRTQLLRDSGYSTMADLWQASEFQLIAINGIGEGLARKIKERTRESAELAEQSVRIRLSADRRDALSTELVRSLWVYQEAEPVLRGCARLADAVLGPMAQAIEDLSPVKTGFSWFFSSGGKKNRAEQAQAWLSQLLNSGEGDLAQRSFNELLRLESASPEEAWSAFSRDPIPFYQTLEQLVPGRLGDGDGRYGLPQQLAEAVSRETFQLDGLRCTLRRYQEWGLRYILHQKRVLLGDEMGLGKTVQAIAAMVSLRNQGARHFLVVCPASILPNWCREIPRHSDLRLTVLSGPRREEALLSWQQSGGVAVTSYEGTGTLFLPPEWTFDLLIVDEAHYIKNPAAQRTQNVRRLSSHGERLLFMTGTALENRVEEMLGLIEMLQPRVAEQLKDLAFMSTAPRFRELAAPVYYRRKREEVLTELPELVESREWCSLSEEEELLYEEAVLNRDAAAARRVSWTVPDLRRSSKAKRLLELVEEARQEGRKVLVFSFFLETGRRIRELLGERCMEPISGAVSPARRQEILDAFKEAPAGTVLVSQILAGGTGLNIQAASVVILCEPQFKPSTENQAISRAYRMGQARNVLVYRLLCEDTVDERMLELLENKQAVFDAFADKSAAGEQSLELDDRGFRTILEEEAERIEAKRALNAKADPEQSQPLFATEAPQESPE